jgi:hypothetical protein
MGSGKTSVSAKLPTFLRFLILHVPPLTWTHFSCAVSAQLTKSLTQVCVFSSPFQGDFKGFHPDLSTAMILVPSSKRVG